MNTDDAKQKEKKKATKKRKKEIVEPKSKQNKKPKIKVTKTKLNYEDEINLEKEKVEKMSYERLEEINKCFSKHLSDISAELERPCDKLTELIEHVGADEVGDDWAQCIREEINSIIEMIQNVKVLTLVRHQNLEYDIEHKKEIKE